jgi:methylated-DNA-protein-cysteine methyltransferase-like protein
LARGLDGCFDAVGDIPFILTVYSPDTTSFFERVYVVVRQIPYGCITSYGAIAAFLGRRGSARMVGWAMNAAHSLSDVPAHRVVNRVGMLTGKHHFAGTHLMQQLLESEGILVQQDQVVHFKEHFWDPTKALSSKG